MLLTCCLVSKNPQEVPVKQVCSPGCPLYFHVFSSYPVKKTELTRAIWLLQSYSNVNPCTPREFHYCPFHQSIKAWIYWWPVIYQHLQYDHPDNPAPLEASWQRLFRTLHLEIWLINSSNCTLCHICCNFSPCCILARKQSYDGVFPIN